MHSSRTRKVSRRVARAASDTVSPIHARFDLDGGRWPWFGLDMGGAIVVMPFRKRFVYSTPVSDVPIVEDSDAGADFRPTPLPTMPWSFWLQFDGPGTTTCGTELSLLSGSRGCSLCYADRGTEGTRVTWQVSEQRAVELSQAVKEAVANVRGVVALPGTRILTAQSVVTRFPVTCMQYTHAGKTPPVTCGRAGVKSAGRAPARQGTQRLPRLKA